MSADSPSQIVCSRSGSAQVEDAVVQRLEGDAFLGQLPLDVLVAVEAQLGVVGKVGAELEEERAEVAVDGIEVELVDHGRGAHDPGIGLPGRRVAALLGAEDRRLLLGLADEQHPFVTREVAQVLGHQSSLRCPFAKLHERDLAACAAKRSTAATKRRLIGSIRPRRQRLAAMEAEEGTTPCSRLQFRHVDVEVHPVDALDSKVT